MFHVKQPPPIVPAILAAALAATLAGCTDPEISIRPALTCAERIRCDVYDWRLGFRYGPNVSGTHLDCRCVTAASSSLPARQDPPKREP